MKKLVLLLFTALLLNTAFAQNNPRPTRSRFWNNKYNSFYIKAGDILVYNVDNNGDKYDFIVRIKKFGNDISFDYSMPQKGNKANVMIQAGAVSDASTYVNDFASTNKNLKDKSTVWLSHSNYTDLASDGEATMDFGNGKETFTRGNTGTLKINYKGKEKIITLLNAQNAGGNYKIGVMSEEKNPLIVTMDLGWKLTLKEVR
jgi:hypothetical protein